jgi:hypothetical protein
MKGIEAELTLAPVKGLTMSASYAYNHVSIPATVNPFPQTGGVFITVPVPIYQVYTPEHSASGSIDYETLVGQGDVKLRFHIDGNYDSGFYANYTDSNYDSVTRAVRYAQPKGDAGLVFNGRIALADMEMPAADGRENDDRLVGAQFVQRRTHVLQIGQRRPESAVSLTIRVPLVVKSTLSSDDGKGNSMRQFTSIAMLGAGAGITSFALQARPVAVAPVSWACRSCRYCALARGAVAGRAQFPRPWRLSHRRWAQGQMGLLYRSGSMTGLTADDYAALEKRGIRVVCDLRSTAERQAEPVAWPHALPRVLADDYAMDNGQFLPRRSAPIYRRSGARGDGLVLSAPVDAIQRPISSHVWRAFGRSRAAGLQLFGGQGSHRHWCGADPDGFGRAA